MSNTIRIYWREYGTGDVGLEGGYQSVSWLPAYEWAKDAAEKYAAEIGAKVQTDSSEDFHVIKTEKHQAIGRYYFMATSPIYVPLGSRWEILENTDGTDGMPIVFGFKVGNRHVTLSWQAMTEDEIDAMHGNDEFGGWHNPVIVLRDRDTTPVEINVGNEPGDTDAVRLMMMDAPQVLEWFTQV